MVCNMLVLKLSSGLPRCETSTTIPVVRITQWCVTQSSHNCRPDYPWCKTSLTTPVVRITKCVWHGTILKIRPDYPPMWNVTNHICCPDNPMMCGPLTTVVRITPTTWFGNTSCPEYPSCTVRKLAVTMLLNKLHLLLNQPLRPPKNTVFITVHHTGKQQCQIAC